MTSFGRAFGVTALGLASVFVLSGCGERLQRLSFSGTTNTFKRVGHAHDALPTVSPGTPFSGYIDFDVTKRDSDPGPTVGVYTQAIVAFHLTIDGRAYDLDVRALGSNTLGINNDAGGLPNRKRDVIQPDLTNTSLRGLTGEAAAGWQSQLNLWSSLLDTLSSDALPTSLPAIEKFDLSREINLVGTLPDRPDSWDWDGTISAAALAPTPKAAN